MNLNPAEISQLIKSRIEGLGASSDIRNQGTVVSVTDGICLFLREEVLEDVIGGFANNRVRRDQDCHAAEAIGPHLRTGERRNRGDVAERG